MKIYILRLYRRFSLRNDDLNKIYLYLLNTMLRSAQNAHVNRNYCVYAAVIVIQFHARASY